MSFAGESRRRLLRALSGVLIVAGTLVIVDVAVTLVWQEPLTAWSSSRAQGALRDELVQLNAAAMTSDEARALESITAEPTRIAYRARSLRQRAREGAAVGRLRIARIGLSAVVVQGTAAASLRSGPGIYDSTPFPGTGATTAIAGHRTTYGAPFRHIDALRRGDAIVLEMPYGRFAYAVSATRIVDPADVSVLDRDGRVGLVLTACHPLFSAAKRIVVFARPTAATFQLPSRRLKRLPNTGR